MAFSMSNIMGSVNVSGIMSKVVFVAQWVFIIIAICGICFLFWHILTYKYPVFVIEKIGGSARIVKTKARAIRIKSDIGQSLKKLYLWKYFKSIRFPTEGDSWHNFNNKKCLFLGTDGINFWTLKLGMNSPPMFQPADYDWLFWHTVGVKETVALYNTDGSFKKYVGAIMFWMFVIVLTFILLLTMFDKMQITAQAINNLAAAVKDWGTTQVIGGGV